MVVACWILLLPAVCLDSALLNVVLVVAAYFVRVVAVYGRVCNNTGRGVLYDDSPPGASANSNSNIVIIILNMLLVGSEVFPRRGCGGQGRHRTKIYDLRVT